MQLITDLNVLQPLTAFYEESGLPLPDVRLIEGREMPEPYRSLLVHDSDMTPTLEAAYGQTIHLRVLKHSLRDNVFSRQVLLVVEDDATAVEFGGIKIYLEHLREEARRLVLEKKQPLGTILHTQRVPHSSHPSAYLRVKADPVMRDALDLADSCVVYGRCNVLSDPSGNVIARVVEILPPWSGPAGWEGNIG
jgi:chorismate-pyruvate lyase